MICRSNAPAPLISLPNDCIELGWPGRENLTRFPKWANKIQPATVCSRFWSFHSSCLLCCSASHLLSPHVHLCAGVCDWMEQHQRSTPPTTHVEIERASCKAHKREVSATDLESSWQWHGAVFKQVTGKSGSTKTWGLLGLLEFLFSCLSTAAQLFCQKHLYLRLFFEGLVWSLAFLTSYKSSKNSLQ